MSTTSITAKRTRLAAAIERDILRQPSRPIPSPTCFTCGRSFGRGDGRFCSTRCRSAFDDGLPPYEPLDLDNYYSLPKGPTGFHVDCAHCRKRFDSRGLRCCSAECEQKYHQKQALDTELAADPFRSVKRKCLACGGDIPNWRKGRRVSKATRFCCARCREKYRQNAEPGRDSPKAVFPRQTAKKCPFHGPSETGLKRPTPTAEAAE